MPDLTRWFFALFGLYAAPIRFRSDFSSQLSARFQVFADLGGLSPSLPPPSQTVLWEHLGHGALEAPVFGTIPTFSVLCPHLGWVLRLLHSTADDIVELLAPEPLLGALASSLLIAVWLFYCGTRCSLWPTAPRTCSDDCLHRLFCWIFTPGGSSASWPCVVLQKVTHGRNMTLQHICSIH